MTQIICTVDIVLLTLHEGALKVALLKRDREPFKGVSALPGGFIHSNEDSDVQEAALRVLKEKTNIDAPYLEQLATFSGPARDPRGCRAERLLRVRQALHAALGRTAAPVRLDRVPDPGGNRDRTAHRQPVRVAGRARQPGRGLVCRPANAGTRQTDGRAQPTRSCSAAAAGARMKSATSAAR